VIKTGNRKIKALDFISITLSRRKETHSHYSTGWCFFAFNLGKANVAIECNETSEV